MADSAGHGVDVETMQLGLGVAGSLIPWLISWEEWDVGVGGLYNPVAGLVYS